MLLESMSFNRIDKLNVLIGRTDRSSKDYFCNLFSDKMLTDMKDKVVFYDILRTN